MGDLSSEYKNYISEKGVSDDTHREDGIALFRVQGTGPDNMQAIQVEPVGFEVYLKSITNTMEIVAKARVKSLDPDELVGGEELGPNWCEAHVLAAIKKRECLVRPYGLFVTIEDAIGATIA